MNKKLFLIFIFGLFIFLLPNFAVAECEISCFYKAATSDCRADYFGAGWERLGLIGSVGLLPATNGFSWCNSCSDADGKCSRYGFPTGENGQRCTAMDACWSFGCSYFSKSGYWDASESKCVTCSGYTENRNLGDTSAVYAGCGSDNGNAGDGQCESACGADSECDETTYGAAVPVSGGTCDNCVFTPACACTSTTIGGCCDGCNYCPADKVFNGTSCVDSTQTVYCGVSCTGGADSGCTFTALECAAGGSCGTSGTAQNIPADKVCTGNALGDPSATNYCDYAENCTKGDCSATKYYRACAGTGSCRTNNTGAATETVIADNGKVLTSACNQHSPSPTYYCDIYNSCTNGACVGHRYYQSCDGSGSCRTDYTYVYDQTVYASAGYSLTSSCGTTGSTLCGSSYLASSGPGDNKYGDGGADSCQGMCDGSGNCDYAVNCTGAANNPPTCDYLSASPDSGNAPLDVSFTASGSDSDGTIAQYEFDFGDGSAKVYSSTAGATHTYNAVGTYCAKLRVKDDDGAWSTNTGDCPSGTCTVQITVTEAGAAINPPQVTTATSTNVTQTSATLNGNLVSLGYDPATCPSCSCIVWFEWGPTTSTEYTTPVQTMTSTGPFSADISGLTSNQTYYFEAFAKNGGSW